MSRSRYASFAIPDASCDAASLQGAQRLLDRIAKDAPDLKILKLKGVITEDSEQVGGKSRCF